jgi:uncharacterized iron-regulated protein
MSSLESFARLDARRLTTSVRVALIAAVLGAGACAAPVRGGRAPSPVPESRYLDGAARRDVDFSAVVRAGLAADVVFFGEQHDDPATHRAELAILAALGNGARPIILSLEMFERDVQPVVDDYLAARIGEADFLSRSRPWERYATDYRALVELARARGWRVVAANVPRRLASLVSRNGLAALDTLPPADRAFVARDLACPRDDLYYERFAEQMRGHGAGGGPPTAGDSATMRRMTDRFYEAQCVKDETMAESIATARASMPGALVLHVNGAFHSDLGLGTAVRVKRRDAGARLLVLSAIPVADPATADVSGLFDRGAYLILTRRPPAARTP